MRSETVLPADTDLMENRIATAITERLNQAVPKGQAADIARRSGVPYPSLRDALGGRQMRPAALVLLARAAGVSLEWLLTGDGAMRPGAPAAPSVPQSEKPFRMFGTVQLDRLEMAYAAAMAITGGQDRRRTMHLTMLLHDALADEAEAPENQGSPQNAKRSPSDSNS
jgi:geranylgeranyl pyrophosphate synthase